jgi:hypothetical protein
MIGQKLQLLFRNSRFLSVNPALSKIRSLVNRSTQLVAGSTELFHVFGAAHFQHSFIVGVDNKTLAVPAMLTMPQTAPVFGSAVYLPEKPLALANRELLTHNGFQFQLFKVCCERPRRLYPAARPHPLQLLVVCPA